MTDAEGLVRAYAALLAILLLLRLPVRVRTAILAALQDE